MKVKNQQFVKLDADESIFFSKELEAVKAKSYDILYPEYKATQVLPVSSEVDPGAETIKYEQYDEVGQATMLASYSQDIQRADVKGKEFRVPVKGMASSYGYSIQEIRAAKMAGKPLEQKKANAARRAIEILQNTVAFFGDSSLGLAGFLNHANMSEYTVPDGVSTDPEWNTKTADEILLDLNAIANKVVENSKGVHAPDTLLLPLTRYGLIATKRIPDTNITVMKFFLETNPHIKNVDWLNELETAGAGNSKRMIAYKKDPDMLSLEIPQPFEQFPPQELGLEFVVNCHQRTGGVIMPYPMSAAFADNI